MDIAFWIAIVIGFVCGWGCCAGFLCATEAGRGATGTTDATEERDDAIENLAVAVAERDLARAQLAETVAERDKLGDKLATNAKERFRLLATVDKIRVDLDEAGFLEVK